MNEIVEEPIVLNIQVEAPILELWNAWVDASLLSSWLCIRAHVSTSKGAPFELFWDANDAAKNSTKGCTILAIEPTQHLLIEWKGPVMFADLMNIMPLPTKVELHFRSLAPNQSMLQLNHFGWGAGPRWRAAKEWQRQAWIVALQRLQVLLKRRASRTAT